MHLIHLGFNVKDEEPNMKLVAVYLVQDPRARLADLKKSKTFRNSRGELREWNDKSYGLSCSVWAAPPPAAVAPIIPIHDLALPLVVLNK